MEPIEILNKLVKTKSVYCIALDIGVSEGTLLRYLKGKKLKPQTEQIIIQACKGMNK